MAQHLLFGICRCSVDTVLMQRLGHLIITQLIVVTVMFNSSETDI